MSFKSRIEKRKRNITENVDRIIKITAVFIVQEVVNRTPVDTGLARSNWRIGPVSSSDVRKITTPDAVVRAAKQAVKKIKQGGQIVLNNPVPYVVYLNRGHSKQAPARFVELAIQAGRQKIKKEKLLRDSKGRFL